MQQVGRFGLSMVKIEQSKFDGEYILKLYSLNVR